MHVIWNLLRAELSSHATMLRSFVVVAAIISIEDRKSVV